MGDVEYILRIVLKARDEIATAFARARKEIDGFDKDIQKLDTRMEAFSKNFDKNFGGVLDQLREWRALMQGTQGDADSAAKAQENLGKQAKNVKKEIDGQVKAIEEQVKKTKDLRQASDDLAGTHTKLDKAYRDGGISQREYLSALGDIERAQKSLARQSQVGTRDYFQFHARADEARELADQINAVNTANEKRAKADGESASAALKLSQAQRAVARDLKDLRQRMDDGRLSGNALRAELKDIQEDLRNVSRQTKDAGGDFKPFAVEVENVAAKLKDLGRSADGTDGTIRRTSKDADNAGNIFNRLSKRISSTGENVATLDNKLRGMIVLGVLVFAQQLNSILVGLGGQLVAVAGSAIEAGGALGGAFAAGMLQALPIIGIFVAAITRVASVMKAAQQAQLLQQQEFQRGEKSTKQLADKSDTLSSANDTLRSALEGVSTAHQRVSDAQDNLTLTRSRATRELEDLIQAEKDATEAAKDSVLNQKEAQEQLRKVIAQGGTQLEVEQAQSRVRQANQDVPKAAVARTRAREDLANAQSGGPGSPAADVAKSVRDVKDAKRGVDDAERSVQNAERAITKAKRGLDDVTADTFSAATALQYMLAQLSPAERRLYDQVTRIQTFVQKGFRAVTDHIVGGLASGLERFTDVLSSKRVMSALEGLGSEIETQMAKIRKFFLSDAMVSRILDFVAQAKENLKPLTDIVINLGGAFIDIGESAGPALHSLLGYFKDLSKQFGDFIGKSKDDGSLTKFFNSGEKHLESWLNLFVSIIKLFAALTGAGADSGKKSVDDLTGQINKATAYIQSHSKQVKKFFDDARDVTTEVAKVIFSLGKTMVDAFNSKSVKEFGEFLRATFIPALGGAVKSVGSLVHFVLELLNIPVVSEFAKYGIGILLFSKVVTGTTALVSTMFSQLDHFVSILGAGRTGLAKFSDGLQNFRGNLGGVGKAQKEAAAGQEAYNAAMVAGKSKQEAAAAATAATSAPAGKLEGILKKLVPAATGAGTALEAGLGAVFSPLGLAIGAVVVGIALLLHHFGLLDNVWRGIKRAGAQFLDPIKKALGQLNEALGGSAGSFDKVNKYLNIFGKFLAEAFSNAIIFQIGEVAKILGIGIGGAIKVLAGFINVIHGVILLFTDPSKGWGLIKKGLGQALDGIINLFESFLRYATLPFRALINLVKRIFGIDSPSKVFMDIGQAMVDGIKAGLNTLLDVMLWPWRQAIKLVGKALDSIGNVISDAFHGYVNFVRKVLGKVDDYIIQPYKKAFNWVVDHLKEFGQRFLSGLSNIGHGIADGASTIATRFIRGMGRIINFMEDLPKKLAKFAAKAASAIAHEFVDLGGKILTGVVSGAKDVAGFGKDLLNGIIQLLNDAIPDKLSIPGPDISLPKNPIPKLAGGGRVGGTGRGDTQLRMLDPEEHVVTADEVQRAGGHGAIYALRAILGGGGQARSPFMADGGRSGDAQDDKKKQDGGDVSGLLKAVLDALAKFGGKVLDQWNAIWKELRSTAVSQSDRMGSQVTKEIDGMGDKIAQLLRRIKRNFSDTWGDIRTDTVREGKRIVNSIEDSMQSVQDAVFSGMSYVNTTTNKALKSFGADPVKLTLSRPGAVKKAVGGVLGQWGERGKDAIHALVGRGEVVLNWADQLAVNAKIKGQETLQSIGIGGKGLHAGTYDEAHGFAGGGPTDKDHWTRLISAVNRVDQKNWPYHWGGGHEQPAHFEPFDCSGFVSYVTQQAGYKVPTTVSGSVGSWGFPRGEGDVTIFYNDGHTFMRVGNKYAGTSGFARPNGGAGWFDRTPGESYLRGFKTVHLPDIKATGDYAAGIGSLDMKPPHVAGPDPLRALAQKALTRVVAQASKFVDSKIPEGDPGGGQGLIDLPSGNNAKKIWAFFKSVGFSDPQSAGWIGNFTQESGLNPSASQPGGPGRGLAQWGGGRFTALQNFAKDKGHNWTDLLTQLQFVMHELGGSEGAAYRLIKAASTIKAAVDAIGRGYERFGISGNRYGPAEAAYNRFHGGSFEVGGRVPGGSGRPVEITAHTDEHIWTAAEVARAGGHGVMYAMRRMLGGGGQGGLMGYADGGIINYQDSRHITLGNLSLPELSHQLSLMTERAVQAIVDRAEKVIKALKQGGLTDKEKKAVARWKDVLKLATDASTELPAYMPQGITALLNLSKRFLRIATEAHNALPDLDDTGKKASKKWSSYFKTILNQLNLLTSDTGILATLAAARQRAADVRTRTATFAQYAITSGGRVSQRGTPVDVAQTALHDARDGLDDVIGNEGVIANALKKAKKALKEARARGDKDAEAKLSSQVNGLQTQYDDIRNEHAAALEAIFQAQVAAQQAAVDAIQAKYTKGAANLDIFRRVFSALGDDNAIDKINIAQRDMLGKQADDLEARIKGARAAGANDLADQLEQQVADLRTQIFESIQADIQTSIDRINNKAARKTTLLDQADRLATALGRVGLGGTGVSVGTLTGITRSQVFQQRTENLSTQRGSLATLLAQVQSNPVTAGNVKAIQDLTDQITELDVQIAESSKAYFQARVDDLNAQTNYSLGINDLKSQIVTATGVLTGATDQTELLRLANEKQTTLTAQGLELQKFLNEAIANQDDAAIQDLTQQLLQNQLAVLQNSATIGQLNGTLGGTQTFATTAWQLYRTAILNGMGGLLPQFEQLATPNVPGADGSSLMPAGWSAAPASSALAGDVTNNYNFTQPMEVADPLILGNQIEWTRSQQGANKE